MRRGRHWWAPDINTTRGVTLSMAICYGFLALGWLALAIGGGGVWRWFLALAFGVLAYLPVVHLLVNRPPKFSGPPRDRTEGRA